MLFIDLFKRLFQRYRSTAYKEKQSFSMCFTPVSAAAAAAAKSLQSCPTLCDPIDGSPLSDSCF